MTRNPRPSIGAQRDLALDITPLVGVLMVLLITVMITAPPTTTSTVFDRAPTDVFAARDTDSAPLVVTVGTGGAIRVGDRSSSIANLVSDICGGPGSAQCQRQPVFVRGLPESAYGDDGDKTAQG